jgi:hypothetical protein
MNGISHKESPKFVYRTKLREYACTEDTVQNVATQKNFVNFGLSMLQNPGYTVYFCSRNFRDAGYTVYFCPRNFRDASYTVYFCSRNFRDAGYTVYSKITIKKIADSGILPILYKLLIVYVKFKFFYNEN